VEAALRESDTLTIPHGESWRVMSRPGLGDLARNKRRAPRNGSRRTAQ
jgi:hypothetical protein